VSLFEVFLISGALQVHHRIMMVAIICASWRNIQDDN
jgi:hypothetical protein